MLHARIRVLRAYVDRFTSHALVCPRLKAEQEHVAILPECTCGFFKASEKLRRALIDGEFARGLASHANPTDMFGISGAGGGGASWSAYAA